MSAGYINYAIQCLNNLGPDNIALLEFAPGEYNFSEPLVLRSYVILSGNHMFRRDIDREERTVLNFDLIDDYDIPHNELNCITVQGVSDDPITHVGIEDVWINRLDSGSSSHNEDDIEGNNILIQYAGNCWVYGVESHKPIKNHLYIGNSNHVEVFGCYFYNAKFHGEGGFGYGVIIENDSEHCLVENNIFHKCRHAMLVQNHAHYNVFSYNYVHRGKQTTIDNYDLPGFVQWLLNTCIPGDFIADLCCHGEPSYENSLPVGDGYRGPYSNLFESNICNAMWVDSFHGKNKKYNTFFRNRAKKYGMSIWDKLPNFSVLGDYYSTRQTKQITVNNYLKSVMHWTDTWEIQLSGYTVSAIAILLGQEEIAAMGLYLMFAFLEEYADLTRGRWFDKKPFEKNSIVKRKNFWGQYYTRTWTDNQYGHEDTAWADDSYYLEANPAFWPNATGLDWPYHPKNSSESPAKRRYTLFDKKTVSRYDANSIVTFYITEDAVVPDDISDDLIQNGDLYVPEGTTLIIDPAESSDGIELNFQPGISMKIRGSLIINGSEDLPVTLKSTIDNPTDDSDKWDGITFGGNSSTIGDLGDSELNYAIIKDAYADHIGGGGVFILNSDEYSDEYAQIVFNNCQFINCKAEKGGAVYISDSYAQSGDTEVYVEFNTCYFEDNYAHLGGAIYSSQNYPHVINCTFTNNNTVGFNPDFNGIGGAIHFDGEAIFGYPLIYGSLFLNNSAGAGGAIRFKCINDYPCSPIIINNSFINNHAVGLFGLGGAVCFTRPEEDVYLINNIFWGNTSDYDYTQHDYEPHGGGDQIVIELDNETLNSHNFIFSNNNIEGGLENINDMDIDCITVYNLDANEAMVNLNYSDENNINSNPNFLSNGFGINSNSPCFDSGLTGSDISECLGIPFNMSSLDVIGNPRYSASSLDIGACEAYELGIFIEDQVVSLNNVNPDRPITKSIALFNESSSNSIQNISAEVSNDISDYLEILYCPTNLEPNSNDLLKIQFSPTKMYTMYEGQITIHSDDPYFPELILPVTAYTGYHSGWNWVSFPFENLQTTEILEEINPFGLRITSNIGYMDYNTTTSSWDTYGLEQFENTGCYKVQMSNSSVSYDIDNLGHYANPSTVLYVNQDNWISYWLLNSQNIDEAFEDDFEKVISIKSESWYYSTQPMQTRDGGTQDPVLFFLPSSKIRPLHYGRGYVIRVNETIENFNWNYNGNIITRDPIDKTQYVNYAEKSDYEVIDVIGLEDNILEVGAYVDSTCVGAGVVVDGQTQILAYTDDFIRDNNEIQFEIVTNLRERISCKIYYVYNQKINKFEKGTIIVNTKEYNVVSFNNDEITPNIEPKLLSNYPNPFNPSGAGRSPSTNISFEIPMESLVTIEIFNVKGQKVKTLTNQTYPGGTHIIGWDGKNNNKKLTSAGIYFYKLLVNNKSVGVKKMLLMK